MAAMYILECGDGTLYVGSARNLEERVAQHTSGFGGAYTSKRQPVRLVHVEEFSRIDDAWRREKQVQGWSHAKRRALIEGRFDDLRALSRNRQAPDASRG